MSIALLAGCADREVARVDPQPNKQIIKDIPVQINRDIDILFMVDNSGSMQEEQVSIAENFPRFIQVLENIEGGLPNVHIGVISSDVGAGPYNISGCSGNGDNGRLLTGRPTACNGLGADGTSFIRDVDDGSGGRLRNYSGTLAETFSCVAQVGINGCGFEAQLESMYRALNGTNASNAGFLRPDAYLAIILLTDEDDCSASNVSIFDTNPQLINELGPLSSFRCFEYGVECEGDSNPRGTGPRQSCKPRNNSPYMQSVQRYVDFVKGLKSDPSMVIVAGIIGDATPVIVGTDNNGRPELAPSCTSAAGEAAPGVRLKYFLEQFPQRNTVTTICNDDLTDALVVIAQLLAKVIGNPCLEGAIADMDPSAPGIQPECQVSDVTYPNTPQQQESPIPQCNASNSVKPCWRMQPNNDTCRDTETKLELIIERDESVSVPAGTHVYARCVVD